MKIFGTGTLTAPGSARVVHDFADGPFDTDNPAIIAEAKRQGFSIGEPSALAVEPEAPEKRRPGRPRGSK